MVSDRPSPARVCTDGTSFPTPAREKMENMRYRLLAAFFAICLVAMGQALSVEKLAAFLQSSEKLIAEGKMTDRELAKYLSTVKLTERLDDRAIEELQGFGKIGPNTLHALETLRDRTQALATAK